MPVVTVLQGPRPVEKKEELVHSLTQAFVDVLGLSAETVQVWITEVPPDSWSHGGTLMSKKNT